MMMEKTVAVDVLVVVDVSKRQNPFETTDQKCRVQKGYFYAIIKMHDDIVLYFA